MKKNYFHSILLFLVFWLIIALVSCDPASKYEKQEKDAISNYLNDHPTDTFTLEKLFKEPNVMWPARRAGRVPGSGYASSGPKQNQVSGRRIGFSTVSDQAAPSGSRKRSANR